MKPPIHAKIMTPWAYAYKQQFAAAIHLWQTLTQPQKQVWNDYSYPEHASGYNRFIRVYVKEHTPTVATGGFVLLEDGSKMLLETESGILQE